MNQSAILAHDVKPATRSAGVTPLTRSILWAKAAGRCEYAGCNKTLIGDLISGAEDRNFGFVAHIVAATPTGPRGDAIRSPLLCNDLNNLMLMCHVHHKLIDVDQVDQHPEHRLLAMKASHENRIDIVTEITEDRASHVLRFAAQIGGHESPVSYDVVSAAMLPEHYPADGRRTLDIELLGSVYRDHELQFWDFHHQNLERQFAARVRERLQAREIRHLSVFALAPQPLLIALGRLLGDITPCIVHQLQREPQTWRWKDGPASIRYRERRPERANGPPALVLGMSATIVDDRVQSVLGADAAIWAIEVEAPHNDILKRKADLSEFRRRLRAMLDAIKAAHGDGATLHVFPALPVAAAMEVGRVSMPKADLPMQIYDQNRFLGGFIPTLIV
jgi:hypothetical protein